MMIHQDFEAAALERKDRIAFCQHLWELATSQQVSDGAAAAAAAAAAVPEDDDDDDILLRGVVAVKEISATDRHLPSSCSIRGLWANEIQTLSTACKCRSSDWSRVKLVLPTEQVRLDQSTLLQQHVSDCFLQDTVVLVCTGVLVMPRGAGAERNGGVGTKQQPTAASAAAAATTASSLSSIWNKLPRGLHSNLMVSNSIIYLNARVHRNSCIADSFIIGPDAVIVNCGSVTCCEKQRNNNDTTTTTTVPSPMGTLCLTVGPESGGGRHLTVQAESTMMQVAEAITAGAAATKANKTSDPSSSSSNHNRNHTQYHTMNVFDHHSLVRDTPTVDSVYLYPHASIQGASHVQNAVLYPTASIRTASTAHNVLMQWDTAIIDHSHVTNALLMEQAHAGPHSLIVSSILGPDVHVSAGEIHASCLGPNTAAHHQSLLIGVLWWLGRGNVGYGANVGSNHTGRLPDQECMAGEGTFWGLSVVVKFPMNLLASPYSIVAAGTVLPPQRIAMPFSLIVAAAEANGRSNTRNDIMPGWLLRSSPYTLARSELKFSSRRKALRHHGYTGYKIIRAETVALCCQARAALAQAAAPKQFETTTTTTTETISEPPLYFTADQVSGIGECQLSERARLAGMEAYTDCIQRFALQGLLSFVLEHGGRSLDVSIVTKALMNCIRQPPDCSATERVEWNSFPWQPQQEVDEATWHFQRNLLVQEFPMKESGDDDTIIKEWLSDKLRRLVALEKDFADRVFQSKQRDDVRGSQIVPGYSESHVPAENDPVICDAKANVKKVEEAIGLLQVLKTIQG